MTASSISGRRRRRTGLVVAGGLLMAALVPAAPAAAAPVCEYTKACIMADLSYQGKWSAIGGDVYNYANIALNPLRITYGNDQATSVSANGGSCRVRYYEHADHTGKWIHFDRANDARPTYQDPDLRNGGGEGQYSAENWDDRISSHKWYQCY